MAELLRGSGRRLKWFGVLTSVVAWPAFCLEIFVWNDTATAVRENPHLARPAGEANPRLDVYPVIVGSAAALGPIAFLLGRSLERRTRR